MTSLNTAEPHPSEPRGPAIWPLVIIDMRTRFTFADALIEDATERNLIGSEKYGVPLHANNGRNPLVDAYQESLDLIVYLRQAMEEGPPATTSPSYLDPLVSGSIADEYGLVLRVAMRLRYRLMSPAERERVHLIQDAINMAPSGSDPEAVRLEAIATVDKYLSSRVARGTP
jgi:hypothetical protein